MNERGVWSGRHHERIWRLLPWYVNGTLSAAERSSVEQHLGSCSRCREDLASCRWMEDAVRAAPELAPSPHPAQLARLMARIDSAERAEEAERAERFHFGRRSSGTLPARHLPILSSSWRAMRGLLAESPRQVRMALAAQLTLVVLLGATFAGTFVFSRGGAAAASPAAGSHLYHTLSSPEPLSGFRVVFTDGARQRDIRELLLRIHGHIVDGPSPAGAYIVATPAAERGGDSLDVVLAFLRTQPVVAFAQPVAGGEAGSVSKGATPVSPVPVPALRQEGGRSDRKEH